MAAKEYYNSFNGGTPQLMNARPTVTAPYAPSAPSVAGTAPPPYQEFHGPPPSHTGYPPSQQPQQRPYNIADFKYNYDPNINYEPSTPPPQHAQPSFPPTHPSTHHHQQSNGPAYPPRPQAQHHSPPRPHLQHIQTSQLSPPPTHSYHGQKPYKHGNYSYSTSNVNLRPQRSSSEPPSPYHDRKSSHRRKHHHHHHHHSGSRSRSRSRERERDRPRGKPHTEKNTFLGALGGGVVGDLIFPGLGTLGGAVLGGWGGHEATKKREREREYSNGDSGRRRRGRKSYDEEWEEGRRRRGEY